MSEGDTKKKQHVGKLTGERLGMSVLVYVKRVLSHRHRTGVSLVGTQSLPLLLQTVLVAQVVLHVGLERLASISFH